MNESFLGFSCMEPMLRLISLVWVHLVYNLCPRFYSLKILINLALCRTKLAWNIGRVDSAIVAGRCSEPNRYGRFGPGSGF
jgi:hypothetical protein